MSIGIIKMIDKRFKSLADNCIDTSRIKNICNIYKPKFGPDDNTSVTLDEIVFSSPEFKKYSNSNKCHKKNNDIVKSPEFKQKYSFFVRVIYACLKIDVEIFDIDDNDISLKNNYRLIEALKQKKKQLVTEHIDLLKQLQKNPSKKISGEYEEFSHNFIVKNKILDKILEYINKALKNAIFDNNDNLLSLIIPYFYVHIDFIEEYN